MAIADPKNYTKPPAVADPDDEIHGEDLQTQIQVLQAQVQALIAGNSGGITEDRLEKILLRVSALSAEAMERAANPSNKTHPGISAYSYPEGDRERPRPDPKCPMFWCGYPIEKDTTTAEVLELLNLAEPGLYTFLRTDRRTPEQLTVTGERNAAGQLSRLLFSFPTKDQRESLPSDAQILRDAFHVKSREERELEELRAKVAAFEAVGSV